MLNVSPIAEIFCYILHRHDAERETREEKMMELRTLTAAAVGALFMCGAAQADPFSLTSSSFKD